VISEPQYSYRTRALIRELSLVLEDKLAFSDVVLDSTLRQPLAAYDEPPHGEWAAVGRQAMPYPDRVAVQVWQQLKGIEEDYRRQGRSLEDLGSVGDLCQRMLSAIPQPSGWNEVLGPFYGPGQVAAYLGGISRQAVADRRSRRTLLGLKTADGVWVYPAFQFDDQGEVLGGLSDVLKILAPSLDDWTLAGWLMAPFDALEGATPIQWLRRGEAPEPLLDLARREVARFER
jgi:hypothetical protein